MNLEPSHHNDVVLPNYVGKIFGILLMAVALAVIYYGVHDGIITQDIAYRTKAGKESVSKGFFAVIIGAVFAWIGILLLRVAVLILKGSQNINKKRFL